MDPAVVHLVQCACSAGHRILGYAYLPPVPVPPRPLTAGSAAGACHAMREYVEELIARRKLNPWCPHCRSEEFVYDDQATAFATMDEAQELTRALREEALERYTSAVRSQG